MDVRALYFVISALLTVTAKRRCPRPRGARDAETIQFRILDGHLAGVGQFPYQALIVSDSNTVCGGSLITQTAVLTAAYCTVKRTKFTIRLGGIYWNKTEKTAFVVQSRWAVAHPEYGAEVFLSNNMAIIFLPKKAPTNRYVKLVTLPSPDDEETNLTGLTGEVSGWGQTLNSTENQEILRWTEVTIIPNSICQLYYEKKRITSKMLCATNNYAGFCHGDHGGPLVIDSDGAFLQVGVASFCHRSCTDETPGAYSKVTAYIEWITRTAEMRDD